MPRLTNIVLGIALTLVLGTSCEAAGLGTRSSPYGNMQRGTRTTTVSNKVQLNRASTGYRRAPSAIQGRQDLSSGRSTLRRAAGEVFGYDARDNLAMGAGRRTARKYENPRDQAISSQRTRRVVGYAGRIGSTLRRIIQR